MENNKKLKIFFVVGIFPAISESWLIEQIVDLLERGTDLLIIAFSKGDLNKISEKIRKHKIMDRVIYIDFPLNIFLRFFRSIPLLFKVLFIRPLLFKQIFNLKKYGREVLSLKYLFWTAPLLNLIKPNDIVHCHFGMMANKFLIIKDLLGLNNKVITSFYGLDASKYIKERGREYYDRLTKEGVLFFPNNSYMRNHLIVNGFPEEKTITMHNPILRSSFDFHEKSFQKGEIFKIIFVGRFVEKKGIEDLSQAIRIVSNKYEKLELHIVGASKEKKYVDKIRGLVAELGIKDKVIFHGMLNHRQLSDLYQDMHIMVLLSKTAHDGDSEGLPYVLLEAQASGLPVVSTYHAGISDAVMDAKTGYLVSEGDYEMAAEKIMLLIENPETIKDFSKKGHDYVLEKFDVEKINDRLLEFYNKQ